MVFSYILLHFGFWMFFDILHVGFFPVKSAPAKKSISDPPRRCYGVVWGLEWHVARRRRRDRVKFLPGGGEGTSFVVCLLVGSKSWWRKMLENQNLEFWHSFFLAISNGFFQKKTLRHLAHFLWNGYELGLDWDLWLGFPWILCLKTAPDIPLIADKHDRTWILEFSQGDVVIDVCIWKNCSYWNRPCGIQNTNGFKSTSKCGLECFCRVDSW